MTRLRQTTTASIILALTIATSLISQSPQPADRRILVRAGRLIDVTSDGAKTDQGILITGDRITRVGPYAELAGAAGNAERIDLSRFTVLPGFILAGSH